MNLRPPGLQPRNVPPPPRRTSPQGVDLLEDRRPPRSCGAGRAWPLLLADHEALLVARHGRGRAGERLVDGGQLAADRPELLLDRAQPALDAGVGVERGEAPVDAVDEVLDALKPLRDRADPAREARCRWPRGCSAPSTPPPAPGPPSRGPRTRASAHGSLAATRGAPWRAARAHPHWRRAGAGPRRRARRRPRPKTLAQQLRRLRAGYVGLPRTDRLFRQPGDFFAPAHGLRGQTRPR